MPATNLRTMRRQFSGLPTGDFSEKCLVRASRPLCRLDVYRVFALDLGSRAATLPPGFTGRFVERDTCLDLATRHDLHMNVPYIERAFANGDRCYVLFDDDFDDDVPASYVWYARSAAKLPPEMTFSVDPAFAYLHTAWTRPKYRGRRLMPRAMQAGLQVLAADGLQGGVTTVSIGNFASLRAMRWLGLRAVGSVRVLQWNGIPRIAMSGDCRRFGVRVAPAVDSAAPADQTAWPERGRIDGGASATRPSTAH